MKVLVTGGTGFVGGHLIEALLAEGGNRVSVLVRDPGKLAASPFRDRVEALRGDLFQAAPFPEDIETVFHLAAVTKAVSPREFRRVNLDGTRSLLQKLAAVKGLRKVVLLSSLAAAGPNRGRPFLSEEMPAEPVSLYGKSKLAQEEIVASACPVPYAIVRAPIVFGPGDMDMLDAFRIVRKGFLLLLGRRPRHYSLVYVKDLVRGMIAASRDAGRGETFYVANPEPVEWRGFMELVSRLLGREKLRTIVVPETLGRALAECAEMRVRLLGNEAIFNRDKFREMRFPAWVCSAAKIDARLHFQPRVPLRTALEETLAWYRGRGLL